MSAVQTAKTPEKIYIAFVDTLFRDVFSLVIGSMAQVLLSGLSYMKTESPVYLIISFVILLAAAARIVLIWKFNNSGGIHNFAEAQKWEWAYIVSGSFHASGLGLFCFAGIFWAHDMFAEIAAITVTLASSTSIAGRNYGSPRMVAILIAMLTGPISAGLIVRGDPYHAVLGFLSIPFFFAIRRFAHTVRSVLFTALEQEDKATRLARELDRALNTMPNGLIMFDPNGRAVVANSEAAKLLSFALSSQLLGRSLRSLLMRCVAARILSKEEFRRAFEQLGRALRDGTDSKVMVNFSNGRYFEFSTRGGENNLGVITFEDVTPRVEAERQIRNMARFDSLTGLPNRMHFREIVDEALAAGDVSRMCALAIFDIDDFKQVNDTHGHPVGDGLVYEIAARLRGACGENVIVSRFGGDEFMLFFDGIADERELAERLDRLFVAISAPALVSGHQLKVSASAGTSVALAFAVDLDSMIVKADLALYKAKASGKEAWLLFAPEMDRAFREKQAMKAELRRAIERGDLRAVYQPIIDLKTMKVSTCEALARWTHPELGEVSPGVFIPLAEDMGIVSMITASMLKVACIECASWPDGIGVSVNLSAVDFNSRTIIDVIGKALTISGLPPHRLEIEVTETAILSDRTMTRSILEEIKAMGVRIALDDYGTGYSNLTYVHSLPLDKLKIDQSFLAGVEENPRSLDLLKATVRLAREMGLEVTIEGVETMKHLGLLSEVVKPDYLQGFVFGPPLPAFGIAEFSQVLLGGLKVNDSVARKQKSKAAAV